MLLKGKRVLVIGGTSGIGLSVARQALEAQAEVILVARDGSKLETVLGEFSGKYPSVSGQAFDATDEKALQAFLAGRPGIDHAVSMVGGAMGGGFLANTEVAVREAIEGKFFAALRIAKHLAPALAEGGSLTLTAGSGGRPHTASGAIVGNAAIRILVEGLAVECAPRVRVNAISPTWMDTPLWRGVSRESVAATREYFEKTIPLARTATTDEVAGAYLFAITNTFLTGQTIAIDGGLGLVS